MRSRFKIEPRATGERAVAPGVGALSPLLQSALDALPLGLIIHDATGAVVARNAMSHAPAGDYQADALIRLAVERAFHRRPGSAVEAEHLDVSGSPPRSFRIDVKELVDGGRAVTIEDVSERRRLDAVRRDFVSNVSHELRTPIGAIGLLLETLSDETDPEAVALLHSHIAGETRRARRLVDELLTLGRVESGGIERRPVNVEDIVQTAMAQASPAAKGRGITLRYTCEPGRHTAMGDGDALLSAIGNLLDNAVKYSDDGSFVSIDVGSRDGQCVITVADEGIGIPARDVDRVFERFYRVDQARSRDTGGAGLGLAIVRNVAEMHDGTVAVRSREGEGSVFELAIPVAS